MKVHLPCNWNRFAIKKQNLVVIKSVSIQYRYFSTRPQKLTSKKISLASSVTRLNVSTNFNGHQLTCKYRTTSNGDDEDEEQEYRERQRREYIKKQIALRNQALKVRAKAYIKMLVVAALIILVMIIIVNLVMELQAAQEREDIVDELKEPMAIMKSKDPDPEGPKPDDDYMTLFDIEDDPIANTWKIPMKSIICYDGSIFEISKIRIFKNVYTTSAEWKKVVSDPENKDLEESFNILCEHTTINRYSVIHPSEYKLFKLNMNVKSGLGISAGIKDISKDKVTVVVQVFDGPRPYLFTLFYNFSTVDHQPLTRERRNEVLDKITKLFSQICDEVLSVESVAEKTSPTALIKGVSIPTDVWNPYGINASFSYSGTTAPSSSIGYWSSPSIGRFDNQDSISFSCVPPSSSNYVTYSVFNITVSSGFIHVEGFFDEDLSVGASIYVYDARNYQNGFDSSYGSSCIGFKAAFTPTMIEDNGSPFHDEYLYLQAGTYYIVVSSYISDVSGYFVVNIDTSSWNGNINNYSPNWIVPIAGSTNSVCTSSNETTPFTSWTVTGTGAYYDIVVITNSTSVVPSLNLYYGNFQSTSQSGSIYDPCYQTSSMHLITSTQQSPFASTEMAYATSLYGIYLQPNQTYSFVVSSNEAISSILFVSLFMRPSKLVTLDQQTPGWTGPEVPAFSAETECLEDDGNRKYQAIKFRALNAIYIIDLGRSEEFDSAIVLYRGNWTVSQGVCSSNFMLVADTGDGNAVTVHLTPGQWYTVVVTHYGRYYDFGSDLFYLATGQQITLDSVSTESVTTGWAYPSDEPSIESPTTTHSENNLRLLWILPASLFVIAVAAIIALAIFLRRRKAALHVQGLDTPMSSNYRHLEEEPTVKTDSAGNPLPPLLFDPKTSAVGAKEAYTPPPIEPSTSTSFDDSEPYV